MLVSIGTYALCDGTREGGVATSKLRITVDRKIQVQDIFRATEVETFDRGNRKTEVGFDVSYTFPDLATAELFALSQEENIPATGIVTFTLVNVNGQKQYRYLPDGKVTQHKLTEQMGVTMTYTYTLVGGIIQQAKPAS
jgi:hypothetical protein